MAATKLVTESADTKRGAYFFLALPPKVASETWLDSPPPATAAPPHLPTRLIIMSGKWIFPIFSKVLRPVPAQCSTKVNLRDKMVSQSHWWSLTFYTILTTTCIQPDGIFSEYSEAAVSRYHTFIGIQANQLFLQACHMNQKDQYMAKVIYQNTLTTLSDRL